MIQRDLHWQARICHVEAVCEWDFVCADCFKCKWKCNNAQMLNMSESLSVLTRLISERNSRCWIRHHATNPSVYKFVNTCWETIALRRLIWCFVVRTHMINHKENLGKMNSQMGNRNECNKLYMLFITVARLVSILLQERKI